MPYVTLLLMLMSSVSNRTVITVTDKMLEPGLDLRDSELYNRTLFTRDDQLLQQLDAGIDAGQHEGGGKSVEVRRFGFNLDHGGVNGGLKVMLDDVQQNQQSIFHSFFFVKLTMNKRANIRIQFTL